jgi:hypothetical protein
MILAYFEIVETRRIYKDGIHEHTAFLRDGCRLRLITLNPLNIHTILIAKGLMIK